MGQTVLEGCEIDCQKFNLRKRQFHKSQMYFNNTAAQLPDYSEKQNSNMMKSMKSITNQNHFLIQISKVPLRYVQYVNYLYNNKSKYLDNYFSPEVSSISWSKLQQDTDWVRLADINQEVLQVYSSNQKSSKSKVIKVLQTIKNHFPFLLKTIKPTYIQKVGLAICSLFINGVQQDIVVDDFIPAVKLKYYSTEYKWYLLVEKAFAKILGNYEFIEDFTIFEVFQEITGLPYEINQNCENCIKESQSEENISTADYLHTERNININKNSISFLQAIGSQKVLFKDQSSELISSFYCQQNYSLKSIPLTFLSKQIQLFKFKLGEAQKISIRLSFLNIKYQQTNQRQKYPQFHLRLYQEFEEERYALKINKTKFINNSIYLGSTFETLEPANYTLYIKRYEGWKKISLILYSKNMSNFKEIHSKKSIQSICQKLPSEEQSLGYIKTQRLD